MSEEHLCNNGRCKLNRLGEKHSLHDKTKKRKKISSLTVLLVNILVFTYLVAATVIFAIHFYGNMDTVITNENGTWLDVRNWVSMTITLIIPLGVAFVLWRYSIFQQAQMHIESSIQQIGISKLVEEIKELEKKQQQVTDEQIKFRKEKENYAYEKLMSLLTMINTALRKIQKDIVEEELERNEKGETINMNWFEYYHALVDDAESVLTQYSDILNTHVTNDVKNICNALKPKDEHHREYDDIVELIENTLEIIEVVSGLDKPVLQMSYRRLKNKLDYEDENS